MHTGGGSLSTRIVGQNLIKAQYKIKVPKKARKIKYVVIVVFIPSGPINSK